jgi:DNA mismatch repair ATPase MutS
MLTTHFIDLCEKLDNNYHVKNCHMEIETHDDDLKYKYKILPGISNIKGGIKILKNLDYPEYIINKANQALNS